LSGIKLASGLEEDRVPSNDPVMYFDLGSPYAYLALARARTVLGAAPELAPVLLGAIFARRGSGSWARTPARAEGMAEIERRAERYGLPPLHWPADWPTDGLAAMRCATWACGRGRGEAFARAVFDREFAAGADIADLGALLACAGEVGLDVAVLERELRLPALKRLLREATDRAWEAGVRGVPTVRIGDALFYGDDQLELAAGKLGVG
jgi:2-hydroxychromene-2-carboxylate isomerase